MFPRDGGNAALIASMISRSNGLRSLLGLVRPHGFKAAPTAEAKMAQLRLAGFTAVRVTTNWETGLTAPTADELRELRNVETAADLNGVEVYVSVYNVGQRTTPSTRPRRPSSRSMRPRSRGCCRASTRSSSATSRT